MMAGGSGVDILFDVRHINQSGIGTYIATQLPYLEATAASCRLRLAVLVNPGMEPTLSDATRVIPASPAKAPMYSWAEQRAWSQALSVARPRSMWVPHYPYPLALLSPANSGTRCFATVHDTLHVMPRQVSGQSLPRRLYARTMLTLDARRCTTIFTPSHSTAQALREVSPAAPILVTPLGIDEIWFTPSDPELCPVTGRYVLYVGMPKWHKNLTVLLRAFERAMDSVPHTLVIAGGGEVMRAVDDRVDVLAAQHPGRVVMLGRLDFPALRSLVAGADLLVMPSLYEGVGLPPLEAMASHTAVLASSIPALIETCGDGAEYFDPHEPTELAELIRTYCCDDEARKVLEEKGFEHVRQRQSEIRFAAPAEAICGDLVSAP